MSAFSDHAANYLENGLSVIPCAAGTKFPGTYSQADGWRPAYDWQKFCTRKPSGYEIGVWDRWPDAGICAPLGPASGATVDGVPLHLVALDIDTDEPAEVAAIRSVLPGSPCAKRGAKGETQFYLASAAVKSRPFNDAQKRRMLDLLCEGRQTVMPPSVHPTTGEPYVWITPDALDSFDVADLPVLPDDISERLAEALAPFGFVEHRSVLAEGAAEEGASAGTHRALNDAALANLAAWVPALSLAKCKQVGDKYKAVASWRPSSSGRPESKRATNLAISSDGIKDCGEDKGYTPLDLVMAACGCDLDVAFDWLQKRVAPAAVVEFKITAPSEEGTQISDRPRGNLIGLYLATADGVVVEAEPAPTTEKEYAPPIDPHIVPVDVCTPPGLLGDIVRWMNASDDRPIPQMNLGAAIAFLGALMGRRFAHPSKGARTNFYCVGVAPTGFGKNHALLAMNELATAASLMNYVGPGRVKSESAIRKMMEARPTLACFMDELGGLMRNVMSRKASSHESGIRDILLELFSKANTTYNGSEGAAERAVPIINPNLCIYGASTPTDLWSAFTSASAEDGFLPRWLVFDAGDKRPAFADVEADADVFSPPRELAKALHALLDVRPAGNLNGTTMVKPIVAEWGDGAREWFGELRRAKETEIDIARGKSRNSEATIVTRFAEHAAKLSLLYAVSVNPRNPVITVASLEWAYAIVDASCHALVRAIEGNVADNDKQQEFLFVRRLIAEAGADGVPEAVLVRSVRGRFDKRRFDDIVGQLMAGNEIWRELKSTAKGGRPSLRLGLKATEAA